MALINLTKKLDKMDRGYTRSGKKRKTGKRLLVICLILLISIVIPGFFTYISIKEANSHGKALISAHKAQNFDQIKGEISKTKLALQKTDLSLKFLFWLRLVPFIGGYYLDGQKFADAAVEELIALDEIFSFLNGEKLGFNGKIKSGPDRMGQAVKVLQSALPNLDKISANLKKAADFVSDIDTGKYPLKFKNVSLRKQLDLAKGFIIGANIVVNQDRSIIGVIPGALGMSGTKNYLLLFQNDKEIRATGGFITAFATIKLENGQVSATTSDDIYRLDEKLLNVCLSKICPLTPPAPIVKYLPEVSGKPRSAWSMRDSNISPDVPTSAAQFEKMYSLLGEGLPFEGIIYIDSQVVENLIEVTGPIDVFGTNFSAEVDIRCNCPNVIYELENYAEIAAKGEKDRKAILGVLMQQILAKSLGGELEKTPQLIQALVELANKKHIIFYMHDNTTQKALSSLNWTGEIRGASGTEIFDGDYLHVNDSNFAGGKTNLYVEQTVTQEISVKGEEVKKKVTIEYKNPQPFGTWLNTINRDYVRIYAPKGSKLISSKGSEDPVNTTEDLGKTVFEAFVQVRPQNSRKLEIEYTIPYSPGKEYKLLIQKQPGAKDFRYIIKLNGSTKADFKLDTDREFKFNI